jgi:ubiquinone/menaquinone biosynthesis C-methylase UbiE
MKTPVAATVHDAAARGFQAGAATYASGRPDYPEAVVGWLGEELGLAPGKSALDVGAGAGKFLPSLLKTGAHVVAIEPVEAMRRQLAAAFPAVEAREAAAEAIPAADASFDAVVCATAFHWFATRAALAEMRRVLKVGGKLGLIWNVRDAQVGWVAEISKIIAPYEGDAPRFYKGHWRKVFPAEGFSPLKETRFSHVHVGAAERVIVERTLSTSFIAALDREEQAKVAAALRALIEATPELRGREIVSYPYVTAAYCCTKI